MKVTALIEKLQRIADNDPTTEIVTGVALSGRYREILAVGYLDSLTLLRPVATVQCSLSFVNPESISG
jgi:hypothetical protein